jgi:Undecaprenyl-phosphate glucose phosphotransferase
MQVEHRSSVYAHASILLSAPATKHGAIVYDLKSILVCLVLLEFFLVSGAAYLASVVYNCSVLVRWPPLHQYLPAALAIAALVMLVSLGFRHFSAIPAQPRHQYVWNAFGAAALAFAFFLSLLFLLKIADSYSRGTFFFQLAAVTCTVVAHRAIAFRRLQAATADGRIIARSAVLIGGTEPELDLCLRLKETGIQVVGAFALPLAARSEAESEIGPRSLQGVLDRCRTLRPDDVVLIARPEEFPAVKRIAAALSELPISLHVLQVGAAELLASAKLAALGNTVTIQILQPPLSFTDQFIKRSFDIVMAICMLVLLSPFLLLISAAIKLDSNGPILFRQTRHGYNNEPIRVFKFRSMTTLEDGNFTQVAEQDPRVTKVGSVLRRSNLDELPQLFNVIAGTMSIVGPRPHPIALNDRFLDQISALSRRHIVKPGITGWAQVHGFRGETDTLEKMQRRFEHDLYYIQNWSFMLDLKIIIMTLFSKSAYMNAY